MGIGWRGGKEGEDQGNGRERRRERRGRGREGEEETGKEGREGEKRDMCSSNICFKKNRWTITRAVMY
jgi:hypothetical protein